jgi:hypothetical protein
MPYETQYVDSEKGVLKIGSGVVTGAELLETATHQSLDERIRTVKYALVDFSQMIEMKITSEIVRQMVEIQKKTSQLAPDVVVAIVAPSPLAYGMSRVWQSFAYDLGWTSNVFHSRPDAVAWLIKKLGKDVPAQEILDEFPSLKIEG